MSYGFRCQFPLVSSASRKLQTSVELNVGAMPRQIEFRQKRAWVWACLMLVPALMQSAEVVSNTPPSAAVARSNNQAATEQDHRRMMELLHIASLGRGRDGNSQGQNPANYDEAKANPFPDLPDALTLKNGKKVMTPETWWKKRRAEIV